MINLRLSKSLRTQKKLWIVSLGGPESLQSNAGRENIENSKNQKSNASWKALASSRKLEYVIRKGARLRVRDLRETKRNRSVCLVLPLALLTDSEPPLPLQLDSVLCNQRVLTNKSSCVSFWRTDGNDTRNASQGKSGQIRSK